MELYSIYSEDMHNLMRSQASVSAYIRQLQDTYNWNIQDLQLIFNSYATLISIDENYINSYCTNYLLSFIVENIDTIEWRVINTPIWKEDIKIFEWYHNNKGPFYVFFTPEQATNFRNTIAPLDVGASIEVPSTSELQASEEFESNRKYLICIGCIEGEEKAIIPELSNSLEVDESSSRFSSAIWFDKIQEKSIILAGLGGIGSYVAFLLSRIKPDTIFLYDDDKVETANMSGQLYSIDDVNSFKVDAISKMMSAYSLFNKVFAIRERFVNTNLGSDIMICGFDNMEARKTFFNVWLNHVQSKPEDERNKCLFIDGRLAAEYLQVLCIRGDDYFNMERYKTQFLFDDSEADETICSYKQTTFMANMIGSIIVNLFVNFVANEIEEGIRDLPFFTTYSADFMTFKTEN